MIEIIREFVIEEQHRAQFELTFGPGGAWSELVSGCEGFRGTTLLRDEKNRRRYLAIDLWESEAHHARMLLEHQGEIETLESAFADWNETKIELGVFRLLAEATVRPRSRSRRGNRSGSR